MIFKSNQNQQTQLTQSAELASTMGLDPIQQQPTVLTRHAQKQTKTKTERANCEISKINEIKLRRLSLNGSQQQMAHSTRA